MSSITFDLGNTPSVLAALRNPGNAQLVANAMAESYVTDIHDWIDAGRGFTTRSGQLAQSIGWRGNGDDSATVYADADYARPVEFGSRPHVIRPNSGRDGLRRPVSGGGGYVVGGECQHPGSRAFPYFFADSAARSEHMQNAARSVLARIIANGQ